MGEAEAINVVVPQEKDALLRQAMEEIRGLREKLRRGETRAHVDVGDDPGSIRAQAHVSAGLIEMIVRVDQPRNAARADFAGRAEERFDGRGQSAIHEQQTVFALQDRDVAADTGQQMQMLRQRRNSDPVLGAQQAGKQRAAGWKTRQSTQEGSSQHDLSVDGVARRGDALC